MQCGIRDTTMISVLRETYGAALVFVIDLHPYPVGPVYSNTTLPSLGTANRNRNTKHGHGQLS